MNRVGPADEEFAGFFYVAKDLRQLSRLGLQRYSIL